MFKDNRNLDYRICKYCGEIIPLGDRYCTHCGRPQYGRTTVYYPNLLDMLWAFCHRFVGNVRSALR